MQTAPWKGRVTISSSVVIEDFFLNFVVVFSCFYTFLIYTIEFVSFSSKTALTTLFRHVLA